MLEGARALDALAKTLRKSLGTGGSVTKDKANDGAPMIELQGDHRDTLVDRLKAMGYPAKPSGG